MQFSQTRISLCSATFFLCRCELWNLIISVIKYAWLVLGARSLFHWGGCKHQVPPPLHLYTQRVSLPLRCVAEKMRKRWCNFTDTQLSLCRFLFIMSPAHFGAKKCMFALSWERTLGDEEMGLSFPHAASLWKAGQWSTWREKGKNSHGTKTPSSAETHFLLVSASHELAWAGVCSTAKKGRGGKRTAINKNLWGMQTSDTRFCEINLILLNPFIFLSIFYSKNLDLQLSRSSYIINMCGHHLRISNLYQKK